MLRMIVYIVTENIVQLGLVQRLSLLLAETGLLAQCSGGDMRKGRHVAGGSNDRHVLCNGDMPNLRHHGLLRGVFNPHPAAGFQSLRMVDPRQLHGVCHSVWFCLPTYVWRLDQPIPSCFTTSTIASSSMRGLEPFIA